MHPPVNALGGSLMSCSHEPTTGWYRDGCCNTDDNDRGSHTVCARVTTEFLAFLQENGNDLVTPHPEHGFPGLKNGDCWCVCAASWFQAFKEGVACPVHLEATHANALEIVPLSALVEMSIAAEA
jgi:uncharacterized protein (DUF2237 family)